MCPCEGRDPVLGSCLRRSTSILTRPDPGLTARFATDVDLLVAPGSTLGVAVSGGPDSLALLLLAAAARPGLIDAATVDHALRAESRAEAEMVADLCERIGVPHAILTVAWPTPPRSNLQARAREGRYQLLGDWALRRGLTDVATAHHLDDQAETLLMRLARGAGVGGLGATRRRRPLVKGVRLVRPLLGWRKAELAALVATAGIKPVDDPANRDPRHDRVRMREWLKRADWADPERLAASATWLNEADEALDWALVPLAEKRIVRHGDDPGHRSFRNAARASTPVASRRLCRTRRFKAPRSGCRPGARCASQGPRHHPRRPEARGRRDLAPAAGSAAALSKALPGPFTHF